MIRGLNALHDDFSAFVVYALSQLLITHHCQYGCIAWVMMIIGAVQVVLNYNWAPAILELHCGQ